MQNFVESTYPALASAWLVTRTALLIFLRYPDVSNGEIKLLNTVFSYFVLCAVTLAFIVAAVRTRLNLRVPLAILSLRLVVEITDGLLPEADVASHIKNATLAVLRPF